MEFLLSLSFPVKRHDPSLWVKVQNFVILKLAVFLLTILTLKVPAKNESENIVCSSHLLHIFANTNLRLTFYGKSASKP